jgi:hypothetical protein
LNSRIGTPGSQQVGEGMPTPIDLQASLSRLSSASYEGGALNFNNISPNREEVMRFTFFFLIGLTLYI